MVQTVGQYELLRRIGQGGMAEVWMGRRASVGGATKSVAIKFMSARVATDERHRRMFLAEARLSMLMNHSNVVQVFDAGEEDGRLYIVMEWIDGLNLAQLCELRRREGQRLSPHLSGYIIGEILRALSYAHNLMHEGKVQCVVHRDVSPHNVLVSSSGEVKLADFGVARLSTEETSGMHIKGKLRYMAPEHLAGRSREPTVDLYGAGAILHELLSGSRFRDEADEVDLYGHILGGVVPAIDTRGIPPELVSLREGLLRAQPQQRIPHANRAMEYLQAWAGYRNAAVELGQVCRGYMGITGPRSGIDSGALSIDPHAATEEGPVTRTSSRRSGPTATAAAGKTAGQTAGRTAGPTARQTEVSRASRRGWLGLVGTGLAALGLASAGAFAVLWSRRDESEDEPEDDRPVRARSSDASSSETPGPSATTGPGSGQPTSAPADPAGVAADGLGGSGGTAGLDEGLSSGSGDSGSGAAGSGGSDEAGTSTGSSDPDANPDARPQARKKPATVEFRLRSPLRSALVRIGGGAPISVAPTATATVAPGRRRIRWKKSADAPVWVDGGTFRFASGRRIVVRLTTTGPVLE